jgi:SAM-dependent methyltransferase
MHEEAAEGSIEVTAETDSDLGAVARATLANRVFWDEPCGTTRLAHLGFEPNERSPAGFEAFDRWFFAFYPYLDKYVPFGEVEGLDVLEVGLGFGSVSERMARAGARLTALDVAAGPLATLARRLAFAGLDAQLEQASILDVRWPDQSFDLIVSLGCLHHTGDLPGALRQVHRLLRPGGKAVVMLYHALSYRTAAGSGPRGMPGKTGAHTGPGNFPNLRTCARALYDANTAGDTAPETVFTSERQLRTMAQAFSRIEVGFENIDTDLLLYPIAHRRRMPFRCAMLAAGSVLGMANVDMFAVMTK